MKKFATAAYRVVSAQEPAAAAIHIVISSHQLSRLGTQLKISSPEAEVVAPAVMASSGRREPVLSTISVECKFPGGRFVEEIKRCDRIGLMSIADEVAADMSAALQIEPTEDEGSV